MRFLNVMNIKFVPNYDIREVATAANRALVRNQSGNGQTLRRRSVIVTRIFLLFIDLFDLK